MPAGALAVTLRTLVVNRKEVPRQSGPTLTLKPDEKLPPDPAPKKKRRY